MMIYWPSYSQTAHIFIEVLLCLHHVDQMQKCWVLLHLKGILVFSFMEFLTDSLWIYVTYCEI